MKARGGSAREAGGSTRLGGGNGETVVAENGVGRGGGKGWGSCGEGPPRIPTHCLRTSSLAFGGGLEGWPGSCRHPLQKKKAPEILLKDGVGGKQMERPGRYLRNQKLKEEEEGGSYFHFSLDFPSPPASSFSGWP